jgi:hypothetical protein
MLSLTFFESYVLRCLRQQGCRDITLIADADGYQMSLSERRSKSVGQDYRLIPVAMTKGIFHPKCIYLSSKNGDILAVGSGNMTFGGFGRNVEVFEVLEPADAPQVFNDFAEFLELLIERDDLVIHDKSWANYFAALARNSTNGLDFSDKKNSTLVHTVVEPVVNQISSLCSSQNGANKITVLSPFHDPDGAAVKSLASMTSVRRVNVALPPSRKQKTMFPFPKAGSWDTTISAVRPVLSKNERPLHAKWFEIILNSGDKLTLTGSVNATSRSLCSTDNIEVGVIRIDDGTTSWVAWEEESIPTDIDKAVFRKGGLGQRCLIHANIRNDGVLSGAIIASENVSGEWSGYLENSNTDQILLKLNVNEDNVFTYTLQHCEHLIYSPGLQLCLRQGERCARGWVNQEDVLRLSREQRSIIRLINRDETIDDEIALLDYLSLSANRHLVTFAKPISVEKKESDSGDMNGSSCVSVKLVDIAPDSELLDSQLKDENSGISGSHQVDIFTQLRRRLLGHRIADKPHKNPNGIENAEDDDADQIKNKRTLKRQISSRLDKFDYFIMDCIDNAPNQANRRAALVIWFEVKMHMLQRHKLRDTALIFIHEWFWKACSQQIQQASAGPLEQHVFTVAAVCARLCSGAEKEIDELVRLHEGLEKFCGGEVNQAQAEEALIDHPDIGFTTFLIGSSESFLRGPLRKVLSTETLRRMLVDALYCHKNGQEIDETALVFSSKSGTEFLNALKQGRGIQYREMFSENLVCPFCYLKHTTQASQDLQYYRIGQCGSCGRFTVNLRT